MATETQETTADIIAEMRRRIAVKMSDAWYTQEEWRKLCDRLEAALKRERGDFAKLREVMNRVHDYLGELIRDNLVEDTPRASDLADDVYDAIHGSHSTAEKSSVAGDCAKLREALENLYDQICQGETEQHVAANRQMIRAALAAPLRNCDRFGGDYKRLNAAWFDWTGTPDGHNADGTVKLTFAEWLLAPATGKEGGNDAD